MLSKKSIYFPSLNGLRFIAATLVFIHHFVNLKCVLLSGVEMKSSFFSPLGATGVTLFFVLSGFLITYLLLKEYDSSLTIDIKKFYIRRMLRIWPLYFLTLFIYLGYGYFFNEIGHDFFLIKLVLYLFFLPNVAYILLTSGGFPSQLWSVGSEEQFYLIYPWIMKIFRKKIIIIVISVPLLLIGVRFGLLSIIINQQALIFKGINVFRFLFDFIDAFRIDCMLIGGLFALLLYNQHKYLKILYSKKTQIIVYAFTIILIVSGFKILVINHTVFSILFGIIILNLASNSNSILSLENNLFNKLGKISYGLYVIHPLMLDITGNYLQPSFMNTNLNSLNILLSFCVSFGLTLALAYLSFHYFEASFLKLKHKFSIIVSGNDVK